MSKLDLKEEASPTSSDHVLTIKSVGVFDEGFCSCGWQSEPYMDGREFIQDDWMRHAASSSPK